jgi:hypothetical protein
VRRRPSVEAPEQYERRVVDPRDVALARPAITLVDEALRAALGRTLVSRSEAIGMLHRVESAATCLPRGERVVAIVDRVDRDSVDQVVVPQQAVVDALLDVRSVLTA